MKILFIAILIFILSVPAFACDDEEGSSLRYNAFTDKWSYQESQDTLRFNPLAKKGNEWSYESPDSHLRYNVFEDRFEYAK